MLQYCELNAIFGTPCDNHGRGLGESGIVDIHMGDGDLLLGITLVVVVVARAVGYSRVVSLFIFIAWF